MYFTEKSWWIKVSFWLTVMMSFYRLDRCLGEQRFSETPEMYQEVSSGEDIKLRCKVSDKRGQCIWQKDRKPVGMHPEKYEWVGARDSDCTLLIRRASLDFDDGFWECQVTPGDFTRQDALTSPAARLLVRVKPRKPRLEYGGTVLSGALTLREGQEVTISCVSRYGNPPAVIKWFIGGDEVDPLREQTNATEVDNPKTWAAHSLLRVRGNRENHGLPVRCLSLHPTSPLPTIAECRLDIHYSPEVRVDTSPRLLTGGLEDSSSFMSLKCIADANPPATIQWYKNALALGDVDNSFDKSTTNNRTHRNGTCAESEVRFEPVRREDVGLYTCKAVNVMGESPPANYRLDVQYGPRPMVNDKNLNATVFETEVVAMLGTSLDPFICAEFDANPQAKYRWVHHRGGASPETIENPLWSEKMDGRRLRIENVVWSDEGEYQCVAYNVINGVRREMPSDARYLLHVSGPPEIQPRPEKKASSAGASQLSQSIGWLGEPVHRLKSRFCSRPPPRIVAWQWGSSHIRAGESINRKFEALPLEPITENKLVTNNCYWAKLEIRDLQREDGRIYTLVIESEKGQDSTSIRLVVRDPTEMRIIAIAIAVGLLLIVFLLGIGVYTIMRIKHRKYRKNGTSDEDDDGSIAADAFYTTPTSMDRRQKAPTPSKSYTRTTANHKSNHPHHHDNGLAVMYDYDQMSKQMRTMSPEALMVRRAPAVLQAPTIV